MFFIILIALGLSMDAFAVSIVLGMRFQNKTFKLGAVLGIFFGFFQGLMPLFGWLLGSHFLKYIAAFDHWVAFLLLAIIGSKMIYESKQSDVSAKINILDWWQIFVLSIATSIDAFAAGISFVVMDLPIVQTVCIIATVTFCLSFLGVFIGKKLGYFLHDRVEIFGGILLIAIGIKILIDHLFI